MLNNLTLGQFYPAESIVHRLDPRAKLAACLLGMGAAFVPGNPWAMVGTWPLLALAVGASRVPLSLYLRGLRPFLWLFVFTVVLHGLTTPGRSLVPEWGLPLQATREGLQAGVQIALQLATAIAYSSLLTLTTDPVQLVWSLERAASPLARLGVPVGEFSVSMLVAIRFFPILQQEAERLLLAVRARGLEPGGGSLGQRVRGVLPLAVPLFRQVFQRAETLATAMEIRGYRPGQPRTCWRAGGFGGAEAGAVTAASLTLVGCVLWAAGG